MHTSKQLACRIFSDAPRKQFVREGRKQDCPSPRPEDRKYSLVEHAIRLGLGDRRAA
jgi:hypothetical protein